MAAFDFSVDDLELADEVTALVSAQDEERPWNCELPEQEWHRGHRAPRVRDRAGCRSEGERLVAEGEGMNEESARALYHKIIQVMKRAAIRRGDERTAAKLT